MVIDHIGVVVKSIEMGVEHWEKVFGYRRLTECVINKRQKTRVVFLEKEESLTVKIIAPLDASSPVYEFASRGGGLHHVSFRCDDLDGELQRLKEMGLRVLVDAQPGEAFDNERIAFLYAKQGMTIELIETGRKAGILDPRSIEPE